MHRIISTVILCDVPARAYIILLKTGNALFVEFLYIYTEGSTVITQAPFFVSPDTYRVWTKGFT